MQHRHFNQALNRIKIQSAEPTWQSTPISYAHLHLVDTFYGADRDKIRVTREEKTGNAVACVRKVRLGSLNIYCPKQAADLRVSVNVEIDGMFLFPNSANLIVIFPLVPPPIGTAAMTRRKDRMRYTHQEFFIDLTQVTSSSGPNTQVSFNATYFHPLKCITLCTA